MVRRDRRRCRSSDADARVLAAVGPALPMPLRRRPEGLRLSLGGWRGVSWREPCPADDRHDDPAQKHDKRASHLNLLRGAIARVVTGGKADLFPSAAGEGPRARRLAATLAGLWLAVGLSGCAPADEGAGPLASTRAPVAEAVAPSDVGGRPPDGRPALGDGPDASASLLPRGTLAPPDADSRPGLATLPAIGSGAIASVPTTMPGTTVPPGADSRPRLGTLPAAGLGPMASAPTSAPGPFVPADADSRQGAARPLTPAPATMPGTPAPADANPAIGAPPDAEAAPQVSPRLPALADSLVDGETQTLRRAFEREVPEHLTLTAGLPVAERLAKANPELPPDGPQAVLAVDRAANKQTLWVLVSRPGGRWLAIGGTLVSTGKPGRKEHFKTPVGTFLNDGSILGYRAEGTFNENHVRGLGLKGMRVWDFGWQTTEDWRTPGATMQVRLEMHSTDPANLAHRIGRPDSEGCIRIPASLNTFLDKHGVIDRALTAAAPTDRATAQLIAKQEHPTPLAGSALVVYDSSEPHEQQVAGRTPEGR